jgi:EmrB/QacA subfamily drug resistance transporter
VTTETLLAERDGSPAEAQRATAAEANHARRWWILAVLSIAQLMVVLDTTVVSIALPSAQQALGFSNSDRQWIVTGYALAFGSLLLLGGRLADLFGRKRVFLFGLAGFAVASALGGVAENFAMLVTARAIQGLFGALLAPAALSLLTTTFTHAKERAKAFGIFGAVAGSGAAIGLLLGGVLTEYTSWRSTLFVNLFFAGVAIVGGALFLRAEPAIERPKLDWPGTLTVSAGLFGLVYGFSHAETAGWADTVTILCLAVGAALVACFVAIQARASHPLLPMRVILDRNRGGAFLAMFATSAGVFAVFLFLTYFLETSLGYSAVRTGLAFLPLTAAIVVSSSTVAAVLAPRVSPRILVPLGLGVAALGMVYLTRITLQTSYLSHILPSTVLIGAGVGAVFASCLNLATYGVRPDDAGVASATVNTTQQVGGSIGTALLNTIAASAGGAYAASHAASAHVSALAAVHSYTVSFWWSAGIFGVAAVLTALILRSGVPQIDPDAAAIAVG